MTDEFYLNLCLNEAWKNPCLALPNPRVSALIIDENHRIISLETHQKAGLAHAELLAITSAYIKLYNSSKTYLDPQRAYKDPIFAWDFLVKNAHNLFNGFTIYVSLEPCTKHGKTPSCADLITSLGFTRCVFASYDKSSFGNARMIFKKHKTTLEAKEIPKANSLLEPFNAYHQKNFVLFKFAQRLDGSYTHGKVSCDDSFKLTHDLRNIADLIVVGGQTVRLDRPTLDARFVNGKPPDVLIVSKKNNFDKNIALFHVPNRKVFISDNLDLLKKYKFILIEGGTNLHSFVQDFIDWYLIFIAPNTSSEARDVFDNLSLDFLHTQTNTDLIVWARCTK